MSREQHFGHAPALVVGGAGVDGGGQEVVLETVGECALLVREHARHETHHGIGHHGCCQLAAREHKVADRHFLRDEVLADAIVDALVVSAEDNHVVEHRERVGHRLVELLAVGRGEDHLVVVALRFQRRDASVDGLALHHHSRRAAERVVVHTAVLVGGVVAQIVQMYFHQSFLLCACKDRGVDKPVEHFGQHCDNVYSHIWEI